jgi:hypothetical protein
MLAAAGSAYAACSAKGTTTIQNSGDASAIASCKTFSGDIAIQTDAAGPIAIDGVQKIDGSLKVLNNSALMEISGDSLEEITKDFEINGVAPLNSVRFPKLATVGSLSFVGLPNLDAIGVTKLSKANSINIDNTNLQNLDGIDLTSVSDFTIANNRYISQIELNLQNVTNKLILSGNSPELEVKLNELGSAHNLTFRNCSSVEVPALESLDEGLSLLGNTFESFRAPNLTEIGGALAISANSALTNISFPLLTKVGFNFEIANNTKLQKVDGFPQLKSIGGSLDMNGNFSNVELPAISNVEGAFNLQATGTEVQKACDDVFEPLHAKSKLQGEFFCTGGVLDPSGAGSTPTQTAGSPKKSPGAGSAVNVQGPALMAGLAAAFFF